MGIEARRHIKDDKLNNEEKESIQDDSEFIKKEQISRNYKIKRIKK